MHAFFFRPSAFLPDGAGELVTRLRRDRDARRKSLTMARERNVIATLCLITGLFVACNLPQSICRMMQVFGGYEQNLAFQVYVIY